MSNQLQTNLDLILEEKNTKLLPENLKSGVTVLGITGTLEQSNGIDTSDATATADDIVIGKTAYVNGEKVEGTVNEISEGSGAGFSYKSVSDLGSENGLYVVGTHSGTTWAIRTNAQLSTYIPYTDLTETIGLTSDKLAAGNTILGVTGTANIEDGVGLIYDLSTMPSGPVGAIRIHVNEELTEFYNIYKCVGLDSWETVDLTNVLAGDEYTQALAVTEDILDGPDEEPGNELPADYDGHLDTLTATLCANELGGSSIAVDGMSISAPELPNTMEEIGIAGNELNNVLPDAEGNGLSVMLYGAGGGLIRLNAVTDNRYTSIQNASGNDICLYTEASDTKIPRNVLFIEYPGEDGEGVCVELSSDEMNNPDFGNRYDTIQSVQVLGNSKYFTQNNIILALLALEKIYNFTITYAENNEVVDNHLDDEAEYINTFSSSTSSDILELDNSINIASINVHDNKDDISAVLTDLVTDIQSGEHFELHLIQSNGDEKNSVIAIQIYDMQKSIRISDPTSVNSAGDAYNNIWFCINHPAAMMTMKNWIRIDANGDFVNVNDVIQDIDFSSIFSTIDHVVVYMSERLKTTDNIKAALQVIETIFGTTLEMGGNG